MNKTRAIKIFILLMSSLGSRAGISKQPTAYPPADIRKQLYDNWYVVSYSSLSISALSDEEADKFLEQSVLIKPNIAIVFNDTCNQPNYTINKAYANAYLREFKTDRKAVGIKADTIYSIDLSCKSLPKYFGEDSPDFNYALIYDGYSLSIIYNGVVFHLEKKPFLKKTSAIEGDTVKCMYHKNRTCSGYVIQGTRRRGKVLHITPPVNKEVPLESQ